MAFPSIDNLRCFVAAAKHLNFRRAAGEMHLTAAALGQRIAQLEAQTGAPLFVRTTRKVELTEAGLALLPRAIAALEAAAACLQVDDAPHAFEMTVATRFELGLSWLVPAVMAWTQMHPDVRVHLYVGAGTDILDRLAAGLVDGVITSAAVARREWTSEFLHEETYAFVAAASLLARVPFASPHDARHHTLLDVDASLPLTRYLASAGGQRWDFGDVQLCGMGEAMRRFCLEERGCCVLPRYMIHEDLASGVLQEPFPALGMLSDSFRLIYPQHSAVARGLRQFAEFLRARPLT